MTDDSEIVETLMESKLPDDILTWSLDCDDDEADPDYWVSVTKQGGATSGKHFEESLREK